MRDRIPTKVLDNGAVRYAVYNENGAFLRYDYMLPADEPADPGTKLSKGTIMTDDVEALIWGAAADRTPNDAFGKMSELYQHWWSVLHGQAYSYYEEIKTPITERYSVHYGGGTTSYSKEISIDSAGNITLVNPTQITGSLNSYYQLKKFLQDITSAAPCYMITTTNLSGEKMFYIPAGATYEDDDDSNTQPHTFGGIYDADYGSSIYLNTLNVPAGLVASDVTTQLVTVPAGETTYVHSPDRNAYPDNGTVDGLTYTYLGVPFDNARQGGKLEVGSYIGTGKYGASNPNTLTFGFAPKAVYLLTDTDLNYAYQYHRVWMFYGQTKANYLKSNNSLATLTVAWSGNTVSYYASDKSSQFNETNSEGIVYRYIALG